MKKRGIISKVFGRFYTVKTEDNEYLNCVLAGKIKNKTEFRDFANPAAVGDFVVYMLDNTGGGSIEDILPRNNIFSRKEKGRSSKIDLIASNINQLIIIQSFFDPPFNLRFVDRLLVRAAKEKIKPILCINKYDLSMDEDLDYIDEYYKNVNLKIIYTSASTGDGVLDLKNVIENNHSLLSGFSGVGKSSLVNAMYPDIKLKTNEISESTGKGRHTTTNVEMVTIDDTTTLIDTPGMREFGLLDILPEDLSKYFDGFDSYRGKCSFNTCTHDHEPKCGVKEAVEEGLISNGRYISYLNILASLREYQDNKYR